MGVQVNISTILPALEQLSSNALRQQFEQEAETYMMFEADTSRQFVNGKGWRIPSHLRPPVGVSAISEGGSFAQPGAETLDDMYVFPMSMTMAFEITGSAYRNVQDESSLLKGFKDVLTRRTVALKKQMNRQVFNDGSTLRSIYKSGTTTITLYNAIDHTPLANFGSTKGAVHMDVDERYDVWDATYATLRASGVKVISKTNKTITIGAAIAGITDTDVFVLQNSLLKGPRALPYIVNNDTGTFQLLSRATYPDLKSPVTDLNGANIAVADFTKTKNLLVARAGVGKAKTVMAIMPLAQDDSTRRLGQNFKRFTGDAKKFDGSFDAFGHGDTVFHIAPDLDEDRIYLLVQSELKRYEQKRFGLFDEDGQQIRMRSGSTGYGSDSWTGALGTWMNYGCEEPRCMALIKRCGVVGYSTQVLAYA